MIDTQDLIEICNSAGSKIMDIYNSADSASMQVEYKSDNSPLTLADKESNKIICHSLKSKYPEIPILSEEGAQIDYKERKRWTKFWLIDPIDGTKEFIKKNGEFTVNIALIDSSEPTIGIVYAPCLDKYWFGSEKEGAFKLENGLKEKIEVNNKHKSIIKVVASRSHKSPKLDNFLSNFDNYELLSMGSSIKICLVAEGTADIYPRLAPTMEWDTAAAHAVLKYANGSLIDTNTNQEMRYNRENLKNSYFIANSNINIEGIIT